MGSGSVAKQDTKAQEIVITNNNDLKKQKDNSKEYSFDVIQVSNVALAIKKEDPHIINVQLSLGLRCMPAPKAFQSVRTMIKLFKKIPQVVQIGRTESVRNELNPNFLTTFLLPFSQSNDQRITLQVWNDQPKNRKLIGQNQLAISNYMQDKPTIDLDVILQDKSAKQKPKFYISCSPYNGGGNNYEVHLQASGFHNSKTQILVVIEVLRDSDWIPVAKSKPTSPKNNPRFQVIKISSHKFGTEQTSRIRFRCYQNSLDQQQLGFSDDITLTALMNGDEKDNTKRIEKAGVVQGKITVISWKKINQDSFLTYIVNGARLHLILGIDYTNSTVPLHQQKSETNLYQMAIRQIVGMLQYFDYYNQIALYGFGAKLPPHYKSVGQCFALNGNYFQPLVTGGVQKIIKLYRQNLQKVKPHGPSKLSDIVNMAIQFALSAENQSTNYYVLIVLTDGSIDDFNDTVDQIIQASNLPLSIVLVGLGNADFSILKKLDQDNELLVSPKTNQTCKRDMIDFFDFKEYQKDQKLTKFQTETNLARKTFSQIPKQFVNYMQTHHVRPNKQKKAIKAAKGQFLAQKISMGKKRQNELIIPEVQFLKQEKKKFVKTLLSLGLEPSKTFDQTLQISMYDQTYFLQIYASKLPPPMQQEKSYKENISFRQQKKFEEQLQKNQKISNHYTQNQINKRDINQIGRRQRTKQRITEIPQKKQVKLNHPCLKCRERQICIVYGQCGHLAVCEQCQQELCIVCHQTNDHFYNIKQQN